MMRTRTLVLALTIAVTDFTLLVSPALAKYSVEKVEDGGTIRGVAKWKGAIPKIPPLTVFADTKFCGKTVPSPVLQIDKHKRVRFVLVYLEKIDHGKPPESLEVLHMGKTPKRPDSTLCNFEEHVFPYEHKTVMGLINYEKIMHIPHAFAKKGGTLFDIALPSPNQMVKHHEPRVHGVGLWFQCEVHVHMNGWLAGFTHPYFAMTDRKGHFEIDNVPAGTYTLVAWHEGYNILKFDDQKRPHYDEPHIIKKEIEVKPGRTVGVHFTFPVRDVKVDWKIAGQ